MKIDQWETLQKGVERRSYPDLNKFFAPGNLVLGSLAANLEHVVVQYRAV